MVRIFDYSIPQDEVLSRCEDALEELGYEIDVYSPIDYHLVTNEKMVKIWFRRVYYILHLKVEDRISVYIYSEIRTFKRASEIGLMAGDLTKLEASENLSLRFQNEILDPISDEFEKRGFIFWDPDRRIRADDLEIKEIERERQKGRSILQNRKKKEKRIARNNKIQRYDVERDLARLEAIRESEHYISFFQDTSDVMEKHVPFSDWSLIRISRVLEENNDLLENALLEVLYQYRDYKGNGVMDWIVNPEGRVIHVDIQLETNPYTPDDELKHYISTAIRQMIFLPSQTISGYLSSSRKFYFSGSYHNLKYNFQRPRISGVYESYPPVETETIKDTFF